MSQPELSAATWRKSSYSNTQGGDCVEIADNMPHTVPVRDSKNSAGPALLIPALAWATFVEAIKRP
ncbi:MULTISPECIES: DUF397 domain-containing protein [Streptomyces]|nr:DUF397 domain-containing protein [Streptomyces venezuelae]